MGRYDDDRDYDEPNFRCPGCEVNNGTGRYCEACRAEDPYPGGIWCDECACSTNHTTGQHVEAEALTDEVPREFILYARMYGKSQRVSF